MTLSWRGPCLHGLPVRPGSDFLARLAWRLRFAPRGVGKGCLGSMHVRHALNVELLDDIVTPSTVNDDFKILNVAYKSLSFQLAINTQLIVFFFIRVDWLSEMDTAR